MGADSPMFLHQRRVCAAGNRCCTVDVASCHMSALHGDLDKTLNACVIDLKKSHAKFLKEKGVFVSDYIVTVVKECSCFIEYRMETFFCFIL